MRVPQVLAIIQEMKKKRSGTPTPPLRKDIAAVAMDVYRVPTPAYADEPNVAPPPLAPSELERCGGEDWWLRTPPPREDEGRPTPLTRLGPNTLQVIAPCSRR